MSGVPELLLLKLLSGRELYGYELVRLIHTESAEQLDFAEGVIYPALHALERAGTVRSRKRRINGRLRVYYTATAKGKRRYAELNGHWNRIASGIRMITGVVESV